MNGPLPYDAAVILEAELLKRIEKARDVLEMSGPDFTAYELRGRIKAYRELLAWIAPPTEPKPEPEDRRLSQPPNY